MPGGFGASADRPRVSERSRLLGQQTSYNAEDTSNRFQERLIDTEKEIGWWHGTCATPVLQSYRGLTPRALLLGIITGLLVSLVNTYFSLRDGYASGFPLVTAFFVAKLSDLSLVEIVIVVVVESQIATMPMATGFSGVMPALQYLITPKQRAPLNYTWYSPFAWTFGVSFFGSFWAMIICERFLRQKGLRFPSAEAITALLVGDSQVQREAPDRSDSMQFGTRDGGRTDVVSAPDGSLRPESWDGQGEGSMITLLWGLPPSIFWVGPIYAPYLPNVTNCS